MSRSPNDGMERLRIIPWDELQRVVPYSRQHVSRLEKAGKFPKRVQVGEGRIGWFKFQIDAWLIERARLSGIALHIDGAPSGKA